MNLNLNTLDINTLRIIFVLAQTVLVALGLGAILMCLPNETQSRITSFDKVGLGIFVLGLFLGFFAVGLAQGNFQLAIGVIDISGYVSLLVATFAGGGLSWGGLVMLPNRITDPLLDSKNVKWLAAFLIVLGIIGTVVLS